MNTKENIHSGHRSRLREQIEKSEMQNISDIHFLEYILTFVIPRSDTNPTAHALLSEFNNIDAVFNATKEALLSVPGIGEKTANFLKSMNLIWYMKNRAIANKHNVLDTLNKAITYIRQVLPPDSNEQFIVVITGKNFEVKSYKIFKGVSHSYVNFDLKELSEFLIKHKASFCYFAHTHPEHSSSPSKADISSFFNMIPLLNSLSIQIIDNLILGEENFFTFKFNSVRNYTDDLVETQSKVLLKLYLDIKKPEEYRF